MKVVKHAVLPVPRLKEIWPACAGDLGKARSVWEGMHRRRNEIIAAEKADPLRQGWEPNIWRVADALLGLPVGPVDWERRSGLSWEAWCERTRVALGFERPLDLLLVSGANRAGKSEWAAKRSVELMLQQAGLGAWCFHESEAVSVDQQQKLIFKFLPPELKGRDFRGREEYLTYKQQTGFGGNHFILPNGSSCGFRFYQQVLHAHEGASVWWIWCDELVGPELLETLLSRVATLGGRLALTFTPVLGWSATVQLILQGAEVTRWTPGFLLPKDGGAPDAVRAMGFGSAEEMARAHEDGRWSVAEDCMGWWREGRQEDPGGAWRSEDGRVFEAMPRVMRCARDGWGVIFFQPWDNPFGNPVNVWNLWKDAGREKVERRLYGFARKGFSAQFPRFERRRHVVRVEDLPLDGPVFMLMDPTPGGRPFVLGWFRAAAGRLYMIREWPPVGEVVPGLGEMGPWAVPSGRASGMNDGARGPAQDPIGWGIRQYLLEVGRIEGWSAADLERVRSFVPPEDGEGRATCESPVREDDAELVALARGRCRLPPERLADGGDGWGAAALGDGARLRVEARWMDCRAASAPRIENDRPRTLQTDFQEWGLDFELAPGGDLVDGVARVNDLLAWDGDAEESFWNSPRLFFGENCRNTIYAMENWTGAYGGKGACKDFADLVRWAAVLELERG